MPGRMLLRTVESAQQRRACFSGGRSGWRECDHSRTVASEPIAIVVDAAHALRVVAVAVVGASDIVDRAKAEVGSRIQRGALHC